MNTRSDFPAALKLGVDVYFYDDASIFLRAWLLAAKEVEPWVSYGQMAVGLGVSRSYAARICTARYKESITPSTANLLRGMLGLVNGRAKYFEVLCYFSSTPKTSIVLEILDKFRPRGFKGGE